MVETVLSAYVGDVSLMLNSVSNMAARPTFNLMFSQLQERAALKYNNDVAAMQEKALDSYNVTIEREKNVLGDVLVKVGDYQNNLVMLRGQLLDRLDQFGSLDTINATLQQQAGNGETVDPTEYNALIDAVKSQLGNLPLVDGSAIDHFGDDGIGILRRQEGGLEHWSVDGGTVENPTGSSNNLVEARTALNNSLELINNRIDAVATQYDQIATRITHIDKQLQDQVSDIKKDVAKKASDLKAQLSQQLNAISLAFEIQQVQNEKLNAAFNNDSYQPGSVVNLFS